MKNLKFGVDLANNEQDTVIYILENFEEMYGLLDTSSGRPYILLFLNGCISFNIGPINTKLENVANFNVLFLTIWVSCFIP